MWIVRLALRRPYTFVVFALLILILGVRHLSMPTDIFPNIDIPVVSVVWNYTGLAAEEMANRDRQQQRARHDHHGQRHRAHRVAVAGRGCRNQGLFPAARQYRQRVAQVTSISQTQLRQLPPGTNPPFIIQYNASSVPILQLGCRAQASASRSCSISGRTSSARSSRPSGRAMPYPYGGKQRQIRWISIPTRSRHKGSRPATW